MKFCRQETVKSYDTDENDNGQDPESFRRRGPPTRRVQLTAATDFIKLEEDSIRVSQREDPLPYVRHESPRQQPKMAAQKAERSLATAISLQLLKKKNTLPAGHLRQRSDQSAATAEWNL